MKHLFLAVIFSSCSGLSFVPSVEHPAPDLWCAQWNVYGQEVLVCAKTQAELKNKMISLKAKQLEMGK